MTPKIFVEQSCFSSIKMDSLPDYIKQSDLCYEEEFDGSEPHGKNAMKKSQHFPKIFIFFPAIRNFPNSESI